jgi:thiamine biosynthesis lipoprotein
MDIERISRRRAITIFAGTLAALGSGRAARAAAAVEHEWRGLAMGTEARIVFAAASRDAAHAAATAAAIEIERLEGVLSLFRADSDICRLNRDKVLPQPAADLRRAVALALAVARATGGLFDPTVQALWEMYADWFTAVPDAGPPPPAHIAAALRAVDWHQVDIGADAIRLGFAQRLTLNGLGQGYVTDRVADLLRSRGFERVLIDLGEQRALGPRGDGAPWRIVRPGSGEIELSQGALATSEGDGCILGAGGAVHHLFDPRTGESARHWRRITVQHRSAAVADALSTAFYAASPRELEELLSRITGVVVWTTDGAGRERRWQSAARPPMPAGG